MHAAIARGTEDETETTTRMKRKRQPFERIVVITAHYDAEPFSFLYVDCRQVLLYLEEAVTS